MVMAAAGWGSGPDVSVSVFCLFLVGVLLTKKRRNGSK